MTDTQTPTTADDTALALFENAPGVLEAFLAMVEEIPEATDDAYARIVRQLINSDHPDDLNRPWDANSLRDLIGEPIRVDSLRRMPSDFEAGIGFYLVVQGHNMRTDEDVTATTGSVAIVAQLARLASMRAIPITVIPREAARPSRNGFRPMHLEVLVPKRGR